MWKYDKSVALNRQWWVEIVTRNILVTFQRSQSSTVACDKGLWSECIYVHSVRHSASTLNTKYLKLLVGKEYVASTHMRVRTYSHTWFIRLAYILLLVTLDIHVLVKPVLRWIYITGKMRDQTNFHRWQCLHDVSGGTWRESFPWRVQGRWISRWRCSWLYCRDLSCRFDTTYFVIEEFLRAVLAKNVIPWCDEVGSVFCTQSGKFLLRLNTRLCVRLRLQGRHHACAAHLPAFSRDMENYDLMFYEDKGGKPSGVILWWMPQNWSINRVYTSNYVGRYIPRKLCSAYEGLCARCNMHQNFYSESTEVWFS